MNRTTSAIAASLLVAVAIAAPAPAAAQQQHSPEQLQALIERSMELAEPGPEHEMLARYVGTFDLELKIWPQVGVTVPEVVQGTVETEMILGGRFLLQRTRISEGMFAGESITILGFDRRAGEFTLIGLDTIGTYWVTAQGPMDAASKRAVLAGTDYDAVFDGTQEYDFVLWFDDADSIRTEIIFKDAIHTAGGPPFRMIESTSRRSR